MWVFFLWLWLWSDAVILLGAYSHFVFLVVCLDSSIEAAPSVMPQRRYCDITGLEVRPRPVPPLLKSITNTFWRYYLGTIQGSKNRLTFPRQVDLRDSQEPGAHTFRTTRYTLDISISRVRSEPDETDECSFFCMYRIRLRPKRISPCAVRTRS